MRELKATDKITQKMTRDGAVSENLATGEVEHISSGSRKRNCPLLRKNPLVLRPTLPCVRRSTMRRKAHERRKKLTPRRCGMVLPQGSARPPVCNLPRKNVPIPHLESTSTVPTVRRIGWTRQRPLSPQRKFSVPSVFLTRPPEKAKCSFTLKKWKKRPNGRLRHNPLSRPVHEIAHAAHAKVHEVEQENVGVEAGHKGEVLTERGLAYGKGKVRAAVHHHRTKPWRDAAKAEQASFKANADYLYQKALHDDPALAASNPVSSFSAETADQAELRKGAAAGRENRKEHSGHGEKCGAESKGRLQGNIPLHQAP